MTTKSISMWLGSLIFFLALSGSGWAQASDNLEARQRKEGRLTIALVPVVDSKANDWAKPMISAAFEEAMLKAGRFKVLSRSETEVMDSELKLSASGAVDPASAVQLGKKLAAKYVMTVQQIGYEVKTSETKAPSALGSIIGRSPVPAAGSRTVSQVVLNFQAQVRDTETSELVQSKKFTKSYELSKLKIEEVQLQKDPSAIAPYRAALDEFAASFTTELAAAIPLELLVVSVNSGRIALDGGRDLGIRPGTEFEIIFEGDPIKRADGTILGYDSRTIGRMVVETVDAALTRCRVTKTFSDSGAADAMPDVSKVKVNMVARMVAGK